MEKHHHQQQKAQLLQPGYQAAVFRPAAHVHQVDDRPGGVEGVHTGVTIRELRPGVCKISLRTEPGELNASAVCAILGGGGHAAAAGATVEGDPAYTRKVLVEAIRQVQNQGK